MREELSQLIQDERFLSYCFGRDEESVQYWENWLRDHPEDADDIAALKDELLLTAYAARVTLRQEHFSELQAKISASKTKHRPYFWRHAGVAASVILLLSAGGYFALHHRRPIPLATQMKPFYDLQPGGNKAVLTLGNGRQVTLTDASTGTIARQGNTIVEKTTSGQIVYNDAKKTQDGDAAPVMNTITTPRGGQWFVILSDGTRVWLNAASSISYPVAFTGGERKVSITGEAYFEVVHNAAKPFRVEAGNIVVEDIGTAFNINAYTDEPAIKATLVNGSARISENKDAHVLFPGEQAISRSGEKTILIEKVNADDVIAWKNGTMLFENENLETILRQASRWYDIDVIYQGAMNKRVFTGGIPRQSNLSEFLKILEYENVHFTRNEKTLTIRN